MALSDLGLPIDRTIVMGILNVTPDSFADGGRYSNFERAVARGTELLKEGADIIDIGGESTRPGSTRISAEEEMERVLSVIEELSARGALLSIDTTRATVANAAFAAGARIINDVSAGLADPGILEVSAALDCPYIAMHSRGDSKDMQSRAIYGDVVKEVIAELSQRVSAALAAGIKPENIILDPGIGFAKDADHNWALLNNLNSIEALGFPVLVGASRKRFLGALVGSEAPDDRESATIALTALLAQRGTWGVRVHNVKSHLDAVAVAGRFK
ncbi:MAG TPA: dihydropteroate synthase [Candidatus Paceibacterota bacterium]|nr:dihydropteroate synthase [Candidatus Paceibacterota bacterium]